MPAVTIENHYSAMQKVSGSKVYAGKFVFVNATNPNTTVDPANAGSQAVDGLVMGGLVNVGATGLGIEAGQTLTVMQRGKMWVKTEGAATVGQAIYAKDTDGTPSAQATAPEKGYTATTFKVVYVASSAASGSLVVISNQNA